MPRAPRPENLIPQKNRTPDEARAMGRKGGIKSGEVRREKKLLSQMYADLLAKGFNVDGERLTLDEVASAIVARRDAASVSMLKEIREATEGNKLNLSGELATPVAFTFVPPPTDADTE